MQIPPRHRLLDALKTRADRVSQEASIPSSERNEAWEEHKPPVTSFEQVAHPTVERLTAKIYNRS